MLITHTQRMITKTYIQIHSKSPTWHSEDVVELLFNQDRKMRTNPTSTLINITFAISMHASALFEYECRLPSVGVPIIEIRGGGRKITMPIIAFKPTWAKHSMWRHMSGSTLIHIMACCLTAQIHCMKQYLISEAFWHSHESDFTVSA